MSFQSKLGDEMSSSKNMGESRVETVPGEKAPPLAIIAGQIKELAAKLQAAYPGQRITKIRVTVYLKTRLGGKLKETVTSKFEPEKKGS